MPGQICPFREGDRVKYKLFGLGTSGKPARAVSSDRKSGVAVPDGWIVPVKWDDTNRMTSSVVHTHLQKCSGAAQGRRAQSAA
jgi:hypothetical protein